jgi:hypothetical protein
MMRLALIVIVVAMLAMPMSTRAADPGAPPGAPAVWLPHEDWVMKHWLPYDETTMLRLLRTDRKGLQNSLSDERTLWRLARRRGLDPNLVLRRLVRQWGRQGTTRRRVMLRRARQTFTQPHLAVHMFFHPFHIDTLDRQWPRIFGVTVAETYREMKSTHLSYLGVGMRHRGSAELVRRDLRRLLRRVARDGLRRHEVLRSESRRALAADLRMIGGWLSYTRSGSMTHSRAHEQTPTASSARTAVSSLLCRVTDDSADEFGHALAITGHKPGVSTLAGSNTSDLS